MALGESSYIGRVIFLKAFFQNCIILVSLCFANNFKTEFNNTLQSCCFDKEM